MSKAFSWGRAAMALAMCGWLLAWAGPVWAAAAQPLRIGVVDVQRVLDESQRGIAARQKLEQERQARQRDLDAQQQALAKMQADLEKQGAVLSDQAKRDKADELQKKVRDLQRTAEDSSRDFEKRVQEAEMEITRSIFATIREYGNDQGFSMILARQNGVIYVAPATDVTADIIKRFDGKGK